jgi:hypothetical protein
MNEKGVQMTTRFHKRRAVLLALLIVVGVSATVLAIAGMRSDPTPSAEAATAPIRLADARLIVEVNATDGDAGLQVFLDGEPWSSMTMSAPDGRRLLAINTEGRLKGYGLTELFSESSEPPFTEFPLEEFKKLFPEGRYSFAGTTIEGQRLVGRATLTHDIPDGPEITSPTDGATVARDNVVARWNPVTTPAGIDIVGYRVIVTREDPLRVFNADLTAAATSMAIPVEFLEPGVEYKLEVQAIEASGNQTLTEITFLVT